MFEKISMKLSQMITSNHSDSDETDVIQYGLECIINTLIPIIIYTIYSYPFNISGCVDIMW